MPYMCALYVCLICIVYWQLVCSECTDNAAPLHLADVTVITECLHADWYPFGPVGVGWGEGGGRERGGRVKGV